MFQRFTVIALWVVFARSAAAEIFERELQSDPSTVIAAGSSLAAPLYQYVSAEAVHWQAKAA